MSNQNPQNGLSSTSRDFNPDGKRGLPTFYNSKKDPAAAERI